MFLKFLEPETVSAELDVIGVIGGAPLIEEMQRTDRPGHAANENIYGTRVPADRPATDFTPRTVPRRIGVRVPFEANLMLWER